MSSHRKPASHRITATDPEVFFNRREFMRSAAIGTGIALSPLACAQDVGSPVIDGTVNPRIIPPRAWPDDFAITRNADVTWPDSVRAELTPRAMAGSHNNFYEFLPGRGGDVWPHTADFEIEPWTVEVTGEVARPRTLDLDAFQKFPHEERLYHFRCVERWAMNVPWVGFPMSALIKSVEPTSHARFIRFESANRPSQMPGLNAAPHYPWPYHEALRLDEAMNDLAIFATGVYGDPLVKQHGAPIRAIVPWKYGYKSPKSIVKIEFLREQPKTFWQTQPHEYGFISNVNPNIPHPRWSQQRSYWLDTKDWFDTPIFNGYADAVAGLYPDEPTTPQAPLTPGQIAR